MVFTAGSATVFTAVFTVVWALDTGPAEEGDIVNRLRAPRAPGSTASILPPSSLAQAFEHVGLVFGPEPRETPSDIDLEGSWRDRDRFLQRCLCLLDATELTECCREPTIGQRVFRE